MDRTKTAAAILAGGRARRLGGADKSRLVIAGRTIIVRQVEILQRVAHDVFIVGHDPPRFADLGVRVHADLQPGLGAMGGISTALEVTEAMAVVVVACDMPFLDAQLLERLVTMSESADGAWVRGPMGVEPLLACYRRSALGPIREAIAASRLRAGDLGAVLKMAELAGADLEAYGPVNRLLANINTSDEYARVQSLSYS